MTQTVEVLVAPHAAREQVATELGKKHSAVRIVSKVSKRATAATRLLVTPLSDLEREHARGEVARLIREAIRPREAKCPIVFLCPHHGTSRATPLVALQALAVLSKTASPRATFDPYVAEPSALRRLVLSRVHGAEKELVASATIDDRVLSVWSCEPKLYRCNVDKLPALASFDDAALHAFEVSETGSRIHWNSGDVDINMDTIREQTDEQYRRQNERKLREEASRYCKAIARVREMHGIKQADIVGLSERQVRRLEEGETIPHLSSLSKLATAHKMTVDQYLATLALESSARKRRNPRSRR